MDRRPPEIKRIVWGECTRCGASCCNCRSCVQQKGFVSMCFSCCGVTPPRTRTPQPSVDVIHLPHTPAEKRAHRLDYLVAKGSSDALMYGELRAAGLTLFQVQQEVAAARRRAASTTTEGAPCDGSTASTT